jgi:hypothetical protein
MGFQGTEAKNISKIGDFSTARLLLLRPPDTAYGNGTPRRPKGRRFTK